MPNSGGGLNSVLGNLIKRRQQASAVRQRIGLEVGKRGGPQSNLRSVAPSPPPRKQEAPERVTQPVRPVREAARPQEAPIPDEGREQRLTLVRQTLAAVSPRPTQAPRPTRGETAIDDALKFLETLERGPNLRQG